MIDIAKSILISLKSVDRFTEIGIDIRKSAKSLSVSVNRSTHVTEIKTKSISILLNRSGPKKDSTSSHEDMISALNLVKNEFYPIVCLNQ